MLRGGLLSSLLRRCRRRSKEEFLLRIPSKMAEIPREYTWRSITTVHDAEEADTRQEFETFRACDLSIKVRKEPLPKSPPEDLKFGTEFTDHMLHIEHAVGAGWGSPKIVPFDLLPVHPAAQVLHYGMSCFEGMKAFRGADGVDWNSGTFYINETLKDRANYQGVNINNRNWVILDTQVLNVIYGACFQRPDMNMARLKMSSARLGLAPFDAQELLECIKALVRLDAMWIPGKEGCSLYIRPFVFASSFNLGVSMPTRTTIVTTCSPVGAFHTGPKSISLFLNETQPRAWPGGVGGHKVAPNYAPTILPQHQAANLHQAQQVLYTLPRGPGKLNATISESGAMNIFFLIQKVGKKTLELVTPPIDGTILPGVTRDSILQLVRAWGGILVCERNITVGELQRASSQGRLREIFGSGTAAGIQPVTEIRRVAKKENFKACAPVNHRPDMETLAEKLHRTLNDIYYARCNSPWSLPI